MVTGNFRDLFITIATSAAALTGLLFVVVTVTELPRASAHPPVVQEVRASAALLGFTNALAVSLFGIVPGTHIGYSAAIVGTIGILFSAAAIRSIAAGVQGLGQKSRHLVLTLFLLGVFVTELLIGIMLLNRTRDTGALQDLGYLLIASLFLGIARAWELVGGRDTGVVASLGVLFSRREPISPDNGSAEGPDSGQREPFEFQENPPSP
jgi:hypothetical protein